MQLKFKSGDFITGIDRSFPRSLYKIVGITGTCYMTRNHIYDGKKLQKHKPFLREFKEAENVYRKATQEEIEQYRLSLNPKKYDKVSCPGILTYVDVRDNLATAMTSDDPYYRELAYEIGKTRQEKV